jgi:hypothetical protein
MLLKDTRAKSLLHLVAAMIGKALMLLLLKLKELIMGLSQVKQLLLIKIAIPMEL